MPQLGQDNKKDTASTPAHCRSMRANWQEHRVPAQAVGCHSTGITHAVSTTTLPTGQHRQNFVWTAGYGLAQAPRVPGWCYASAGSRAVIGVSLEDLASGRVNTWVTVRPDAAPGGEWPREATSVGVLHGGVELGPASA